ncbi:MAG: tRNA (N6-isopentenyl adenosine(37)-C2)-methylthiotransferase MiaB [Eubacterium sp.]|nr:tRNA (N6-isopentenyl adenosine(37)-C2)-methylthiotransferase MiaB [Eubacterium sp.]
MNQCVISNIPTEFQVEKPVPEKEPERQDFFISLCRNYIKQNLEKGLTYAIVTFGCQMNVYDSERLKGVLERIGYTEAPEKEADLVIFNTCTVRENANQRLYGHLGQLKPRKKTNPHFMIGLCGCMMQEPEVVAKINTSYPFVDFLFGTFNLHRLPELLYARLQENKRMIEVLPEPKEHVEIRGAKRKYPFKSGVNIMYGCNNFCTYCIVPYVRGRERSRTPEDILQDVRELAEDGVTEIMLLGQNVNSYGTNFMEQSEIIDHEPEYGFPELLEAVCGIPGIMRVRFMTSHPKDLSEKLIRVIARNPKVCRHIHLPIQTGSTKLLQAMNRHYTKESYLELVEKIRAALPDVSLTTDIMVGFPGETEEDIDDTIDVVRRAAFDQAFTFIYSPRTGTPAAAMEQLPEDVVKARFQRLLDVVNEVAHRRCGRFEGTVKQLLVEEENDQIPGYVTGRTEENLLVHFPGEKSLIGQYIPVLLKESKGFYYIGEADGTENTLESE